jgi:hypothetical protein
VIAQPSGDSAVRIQSHGGATGYKLHRRSLIECVPNRILGLAEHPFGTGRARTLHDVVCRVATHAWMEAGALHIPHVRWRVDGGVGMDCR